LVDALAAEIVVSDWSAVLTVAILKASAAGRCQRARQVDGRRTTRAAGPPEIGACRAAPLALSVFPAAS
jgi:hypothetical protein